MPIKKNPEGRTTSQLLINCLAHLKDAFGEMQACWALPDKASVTAQKATKKAAVDGFIDNHVNTTHGDLSAEKQLWLKRRLKRVFDAEIEYIKGKKP